MWVRAIPGAYMTTVSDTPQVRLRRNGILGACHVTDCSFEFKDPGTVTALSPTVFDALGEVNVLTITGTKLRQVTDVRIGGLNCIYGGTTCNITSATTTKVVVTFSALSYGKLNVEVTTSLGRTRPRDEASKAITVAAQAVTVTPNYGTLNGGTTVTLSGRGIGLNDYDIVFQSVLAKTISRKSDEIVVVSPPGKSLGLARVGFSSGVDFAGFTYDNRDEVRITLSNTDFSVTGGDVVTITFDTQVQEDVQIFIGEESFGPYFVDDGSTYNFIIPPHAAGKGMKFKVHVPGRGFTNSVNVRYRLTVSTVTPDASSTSGGARLTINGRGFGTNTTICKVTVRDIPCDIESITNMKIICRTRQFYQRHQAVFQKIRIREIRIPKIRLIAYTDTNRDTQKF